MNFTETDAGLSVASLAARDSDNIATIDSTARNGDFVSRRRFQRGSVFLNKSKNMWLGMYCEYFLDEHGVERRNRKRVVLCPVQVGGKVTRKREVQKLLQPYVDRVNSSLSTPARERKNATFSAFAAIWERDYLSLAKPSTQSGTRSYLKRLRAAFGNRDMRQIDAGDIQRLISAMTKEGLAPKTVRHVWATVNLIWNAALAQKYVDAVLPKPKLPRRSRTRVRYFTMNDVARMTAASKGEQRAFCWLAAETGLRAGELAGLMLTDIDGDRLAVSRSVWHSHVQAPKTENAVRTLALSPQLVALLWEQIARQRTKGHDFLFTSATGTPLDMNVYRRRKLCRLLKDLEIEDAGFHAFRHFNVSLLDVLRAPLKVIQERAGHALTGSFTLDVYGDKPDWERNLEAARNAGAVIEQAVQELAAENAESFGNSVTLSAHQRTTASDAESEAVESK